MRLQLQNVAASRSGVALHKYRGSLQTIATLLREEGLTSPFKVKYPLANARSRCLTVT